MNTTKTNSIGLIPTLILAAALATGSTYAVNQVDIADAKVAEGSHVVAHPDAPIAAHEMTVSSKYVHQVGVTVKKEGNLLRISSQTGGWCVFFMPAGSLGKHELRMRVLEASGGIQPTFSWVDASRKIGFYDPQPTARPIREGDYRHTFVRRIPKAAWVAVRVNMPRDSHLTISSVQVASL